MLDSSKTTSLFLEYLSWNPDEVIKEDISGKISKSEKLEEIILHEIEQSEKYRKKIIMNFKTHDKQSTIKKLHKIVKKIQKELVRSCKTDASYIAIL